MTSDKLEKTLLLLQKAMDRVAEVLLEPVSPIVMDATIQRFEFTYELMWKTLKIYLEDIHGIRAVSPRLVFKETYALSLIEEEDIYLEMIKSRNLLFYTYNEEQANEIYKKGPSFLNAIKNLYPKISSH